MQEQNPYAPSMVSERDQHALAEDRARFLVRTYGHLLGAILAFVGIEVFLFQSGLALPIAQTFLSVSWLIILGAFMLVGWIGSSVAARATSMPAQYIGLAIYVLAEAFIFVPLLVLAEMMADGVIASAAVTTIVGFIGLTAVAIWSRRDFSALGALLKWAGVCAILLIVAGVVFGFQLGTWFSVAMIALAGGAILYDTGKIVHHYPTDRHVGAALELFAAVALMFWYVLRLFMAFGGDD